MAWCPSHICNQREQRMGNAAEIYALRYATLSPRTPHMNFLAPDPHDTGAQDLDYFVWLIRNGGRDILVDTGFNAEEARLRSRTIKLNPVEALAGMWGGCLPHAARWCWPPMPRITTPICTSAARSRSSTTSVTWPLVGRP